MSSNSDQGAAGKEDHPVADLNFKDITSGSNERDIPAAKFLEDINSFANSFDPPATSELLIGAFSDLFGKYKKYEAQLTQKKLNFQAKIPEIEKNLSLVKFLKGKQEEGETIDTRYNLSDMVYANAELDCSTGVVCLWLGANVMLECKC